MIVYTSSSTPLNAEEKAGIVVQVLVKTLIEKELDTSFKDETESGVSETVKVKDSEAGTLDLKEMRVRYCYVLTSGC